jgi:hypothetical protein
LKHNAGDSFLWPFLKAYIKTKKRFESGCGKKGDGQGEKAYSLAILTIRREETRKGQREQRTKGKKGLNKSEKKFDNVMVALAL